MSQGSDIRPEQESNLSPEHCFDPANNSPTCNPAGSIFSSPKLVGSSNPFAVRSSPGRLNDNSEPSSQSISSIIAPSKFGASSYPPQAPPAAFSSSLIAANHSAKETHDSGECNGSSSKGTFSSFSSSSGTATQPHHFAFKPAATLGNPFAVAVDTGAIDNSSPTCSNGTRRSSSDPATESSKQALVMPSRLDHVTTAGASPTAPAAAGEDGGGGNGGSGSGTATCPSAATPLSTGNLFATALASGGTTPSAAPATFSTFVFGQKLHERVANANHSTTSNEPSSNGSSASDNLFTVIPKEKTETESASSNGVAASKTLSEAAREIEEAQASKRKYDEVTVITGEEDEQNALQVYGKLFTFDKGNWVERGRGTLRLNDKQVENQTLQSRLVMRTQGCLRVILNTKVWADMTIDKTSSKSIRLTAVDSDSIRVFTFMASLKDTETLFNALEWRLATLRAQQSRVAATTAVSAGTSSDLTSSSSSSSGEHVVGNEDVGEAISSSGTSSKRTADADLGEPDEAKKKRSE